MIDKINCLKCRYYMVTWDSRFPRGCKLFEFKGSMMPSIMVYKSTGSECQNFSLKQMQKDEGKSV